MSVKLKKRSQPPSKIRRFLIYFLKISVLVALYVITARFSLSFDAVSRFASLIWLPSGIAFVAILAYGYRFWPAILIGAFLVNFLNGAPLLVALGIGIGNTLEAVIGTFLFRKSRIRPTFERLRDVLLFTLIVVPLASGISATIGVSSLFQGHVISFSASLSTWKAWWLGDVTSMVMLSPFLLLWRRPLSDPIQIKRILEALLLTILTIGVSFLVFGDFFHTQSNISPITYLVFPPLIWASLRFGQRGATVTILLLSILAIIGTVQNFGPFAAGSINESLLLLQLFMGVTTITAMILAASVSEKKVLESRKDEFIGMASHELRTPVTSLKVYTQLLQRQAKKSGNEELSLSLAKMNTQIDKLIKLINELLNLSKMQTGKLEYHDGLFDLNKLVHEVVDTIKTTSKKHKILIEGEVKKRVYGDKDHIGQVIINLLNNAIKYSPQANKIIVRLKQDKNDILVSVKDFGLGISKTHQEKIFDRFYQVTMAKERAFSGLGIGLYIANRIVRRHNGKMWVESTKGKGSTFTFSLPLKRKK